MIRLITLSLILLFPNNVAGQAVKSSEYKIRLTGMEIGTLTATQRVEDSTTTFSMNSTVDFWLIVSVNVKHMNTSIFKKNQLISSVSTSTTSKGNFMSSIVWKNNGYTVNVDAYEYVNSEPINKVIYANVSSLYFKEPLQVKELLADGFGKLCPVKKLGEGVYEVDVLGNKNTYYYESGVLVRANMYSKFKNYEIVLHHGKD